MGRKEWPWDIVILVHDFKMALWTSDSDGAPSLSFKPR
jgi:predicted transcriptional regulator